MPTTEVQINQPAPATIDPSTLPLLVSFARVEGKLDTVLTQQQDHEKRLRELEARPATSIDHETRLRAVESKSTVSPAALWGAILGAATLVVAILTIIEKLTT